MRSKNRRLFALFLTLSMLMTIIQPAFAAQAPAPAAEEYTYEQLDRTQFTEFSATSEQPTQEYKDGPAELAFDGDLDTGWHSDYGTNTLPQSIEWALGGTYPVGKIECQKKHGGSNGVWKDVTIEGRTESGWVKLAAASDLENADCAITFPPQNVSALRVTVNDSHNAYTDGSKFASAGEIHVYTAKETTPPPVEHTYTLNITTPLPVVLNEGQTGSASCVLVDENGNEPQGVVYEWSARTGSVVTMEAQTGKTAQFTAVGAGSTNVLVNAKFDGVSYSKAVDITVNKVEQQSVYTLNGVDYTAASLEEAVTASGLVTPNPNMPERPACELTSIEFKSGVIRKADFDYIKGYGKAFAFNLTTFKIGDEVVPVGLDGDAIPNDAFYLNDSGDVCLETVYLGRNIKGIGQSAFATAKKVTSFAAPGVEFIKNEGIAGLYKLKTIDFPALKEFKGITKNYNSYAETVNLPGVESISYDAFRMFDHLTDVTLGAVPPTIPYNTLLTFHRNVDGKVDLHVPEEAIPAYQADECYNPENGQWAGLNLVVPKPEITGVAEVNGTGYPTLDAAFAAAPENAVVKVLENVALTAESPALTLTNSITLDLNGCTITGVGGSVITVPSGKALTLADNSEAKSGQIIGQQLTGPAAADAQAVAVNVAANGALIVNSGRLVGQVITGDTAVADGRAVMSSGTVTVNGGELVGVKLDGSLTQSTGTFAAYGVWNMSALTTVKGDAQVVGLEISGNAAAGNTAAVLSYHAVTVDENAKLYGTLFLSGGSVQSNDFKSDAISVLMGSRDVTVNGNAQLIAVKDAASVRSKDCSAIRYLADGSVTVSGGVLTSAGGPVVKMSSGKQLTVTDGSFTAENGTCVALYGEKTALSISGGLFHSQQKYRSADVEDYRTAKTSGVTGGVFAHDFAEGQNAPALLTEGYMTQRGNLADGLWAPSQSGKQYKVMELVVAKLTAKVNGTQYPGADLADIINQAGGVDAVTTLEMLSGTVTQTDLALFKDMVNLSELTMDLDGDLTVLNAAGQPTTIIAPDEAQIVYSDVAVSGSSHTPLKKLSMAGFTEIRQNGLKKDADRGTRGNPGFTHIYLPDVVTVGDMALYNMTNLDTLDLRSAKTIGASAFYGDKHLRNLDLSVVETIGGNAFNGTDDLTTFTFPATLKKLDNIAFAKSGSNNTKTIHVTMLGETAPQMTGTNFKGAKRGSTITVPYSGLTSYVKNFNLDGYAKLVQFDGVDVLADGAYRVKFNGANSWEYASAFVKEGEALKASQVPSFAAPVEGQQLMGWALKKNSDDILFNGAGYVPTADTEVYAVFQTPPVVVEYTVTFKAEGMEDVVTKVNSGEKIGALPEAPAKTGYTFDGWFDGKTEITADTVVENNITATAKYTLNSYSVTFKADGQQDVVVSVSYGEKIGSKLPKAPAKTGYTFDGWFDGKTEITADTVVENNITATAKYTPNSYDVTFKADGQQDVVVSVSYGETIGSKLPKAPAKAGYTFNGWFDGETEITADTVVEGNITATAKYTLNSYDVTFKADGQQDVVVSVSYGQTIGSKLPKAPAKTGYTFDGWFDGKTEITADTVVKAEITAAAKYTLNTYTVTVDGVEYRNVPYGTALIKYLPKEDPAKAGHSFNGWFVGNKQVDSKTLVEGPVTVEARWSFDVFTDVAKSDWFYEQVRYATFNGLFSGVSGTEFGPAIGMDRAMVVQVLYNLAGKPDVELNHDFDDVDNTQWYAEAVAWAVKEGIASGYGNGQFGPTDRIDRQQMAVMLYAFSGKHPAQAEMNFADVDEIDSWAREGMEWAVAHGIMGGVGGNLISPHTTTTRAEAAVMIGNFYQMDK